MPSGKGALSSAGSVGIWPVTKSQPSQAVAWLNGATGVGAPATIRNSIIFQSPLTGLVPVTHVLKRCYCSRKTRMPGTGPFTVGVG